MMGEKARMQEPAARNQQPASGYRSCCRHAATVAAAARQPVVRRRRPQAGDSAKGRNWRPLAPRRSVYSTSSASIRARLGVSVAQCMFPSLRA